MTSEWYQLDFPFSGGGALDDDEGGGGVVVVCEASEVGPDAAFSSASIRSLARTTFDCR